MIKTVRTLMWTSSMSKKMFYTMIFQHWKFFEKQVSCWIRNFIKIFYTRSNRIAVYCSIFLNPKIWNFNWYLSTFFIKFISKIYSSIFTFAYTNCISIIFFNYFRKKSSRRATPNYRKIKLLFN